MSMEDLIGQGMVMQKKQQMMQATADGKAALRALAREAVYAKGKAIEEIDTDSLLSHLNRLLEKKNEVIRLQQEIRELEY